MTPLWATALQTAALLIIQLDLAHGHTLIVQNGTKWQSGIGESGKPLTAHEWLQIANNGKLAPGWALVPGGRSKRDGVNLAIRICDRRETNPTDHIVPRECDMLAKRCVQKVWFVDMSLEDETMCTREANCPDGQAWGPGCSCANASVCGGIKNPIIWGDYTCDTAKLSRQHLTGTAIQWMGRNAPCSVAGVNLSLSCDGGLHAWRRLMWAQTDEVLYVGEALKVSIDRSSKNPEDYSCQNTTDNQKCEGCGVGSCKGDTDFNRAFPGSKKASRRQKECYCTLKPHRSKLEVYDENGEKRAASCYGKQDFKVLEHLPELAVSAGPPMACQGCEVKCTRNGLMFASPFTPITSAFACANPVCISGNIDAHAGVLVFRPEMLLTHRAVSYKFWLEGKQEPVTGSVRCTEFDFCLSFNGWFDFRLLVQPHCWKKVNMATILGTAVIVILIICVSLCIFSLLLVAWIVCKPCRVVSWWLLRLPFRLCLFACAWLHHKSQEESWKQTESPALPSHSKTRNPPRSSLGRPLLRTSLMVIIILIQNSCADISFSQSVAQPDCTANEENKLVCSLSFNTRMVIQPVGQKTVLNFLNEDNQSIGAIWVETQEVTYKCQDETLYHTTEMNLEVVMKTECGGDSCQEKNCLDYPDKGVLVEHRSAGLAVHKCIWTKARAGCWWDKIIGEGECWWAWAKFEQKGSVCVVKRCSNWVKTAKVKVSRQDADGETVKILNLQPTQESKVFADLSIATENIIVERSWSMAECFMICDGRSALTPCNDKGQYVLGKVGELQCPTRRDALVLSHHCKMNPAMLSLEPMSDERSIHHKLTQRNLNMIMAAGLLPRLSGGSLIMPTEAGSLISAVTNFGEFTLDLKSQKYKLIPTVQTIKCEVSFVNLTGCYDCSAGALLLLKARTEWGEGLANLECKDHPTIPFAVNTTTQLIEVNLHFNTPHVQMTCTAVCPKTKEVIEVTGALEFIGQIKDTSEERINNTRPEGEKPGPSIFDEVQRFYKALKGIFGHIWLEIAVVLCLCVVTVVAAGACYLKMQAAMVKKFL